MRPNPCVKAVAALAALAFGALVPAAPPLATAVEESVTTINILGVADLHGHIERTTDPATGEVVDPGAATVACEVAGARESDPGSLLVSSGDNVGGSPPVSALLDDQPTLDVLNAMGTDVSALGDHELDKGLDDLTGRILPAASFPYLSANVTGTALDSEGDGDGTVVKNAGGVKVGFVGIMTDDLPSLLAPTTADALTLAPAVATANARAAELKRTGAADVVVVLAHADAAEMAPRLTGDVDAVLGGYDRIAHPAAGGAAVATTTDGQDIAVVQADHDGRGLADVSLAYNAATREVSVVGAADKDLRASDCTADAYGVKGIVAEASARAAVLGDQRAAVIGSDFLRGSADGATPGTSLGTESTASDLVADSYARWAAAGVPHGDAARVVGLMSADGVRADLLYAGDAADGSDDGVLTSGELQAVQPAGNEMSYATVTGAQLKAALAQQWRPGGSPGVLTLGTSSNVSVRIDQGAADELYAIHDEIIGGATTADAAAPRIADARSRVIASVVIDGSPLADNETVLVASSSSLIGGGEGYAALSEASPVNTGAIDRDVVAGYLADVGSRPATASYVKHQIGLGSTISRTSPRAVALDLTGLAYSNDSEKRKGVTSARYSYRDASGATVTSDAVAVDASTVADRPETGRAALEIVFGDSAATRTCSFDSAARDRSCFLATIELLDASGAVVGDYDYELATDGSADAYAAPGDSATGAGGAFASRHADDVIVGPAPAERADHDGDLVRTGASIGIGAIALGLVVAGAIVLIRRRGRPGDAPDDVGDPDDAPDDFDEPDDGPVGGVS